MTSRTRNNDVDKGWAWLVLVAVYVGIVILSASTYMNGVIYLALLEKYHTDTARTSLIGSLNGGLLSLFGPFVSVFINIFNCRVSMVTGGLLMTIGCISSAFVSKIEHLILTYGVLTGIGSSMVSTPFVVTLAFYFNKRRNLVISLSTAVIGIGMLISAPMALAILQYFGLHDSFIFLGGFNAQLIVIGMICRPSSVETSIRSERRIVSSRDSNKYIKHEQTRLASFINLFLENSYSKLLLNVPLLFFLFSTMTWNSMLSISLMHLPNYMSIHGFGSIEVTAIMTCFSISNTIGRFLGALTVDRAGLDSLTLHSVTLVLAGLVTVTFPFYSVIRYTEYVFAVLVGLTAGVPNSIMTPITLKMVGVEKITAAHGLEYMFCGIGYTIGPPIAAALYTHTGTYKNSFIFSGCIVLAGGGIGILANLLLKRQTTMADSGSHTDVLQSQKIDVNVTRGKPETGEANLLSHHDC